MNINVLSKDGACNFDCQDGETILYAGLRQGVTLPYECATGTCGACRARLSEGEIELVWPQAPALAKIKREKGDILLCQARAKTDCKLMIAANIAAQPGNVMPEHRSGKIQKLRRLTPDVMHFELVLSSPMSFKAGQFVVVETKHVPGRRAYSMVNYEPDTHTIALVVKRKLGGGFSDWLFEGDVESADLDVFGPLGQATFNEGDDRNLICIAGGSGIAGIMSILECATKKNYFRTHKGYVFFGVRTPADAFYQEQLAQYVEASEGNLEVTIAFSHDANTVSDLNARRLTFAAGMVHEVAAQAMVGRHDDLIGYVAGPVPMVDGAIRMLITEAGLSSQWIRYDKFS